MPDSNRTRSRHAIVVVLALGAFSTAAFIPWHADPHVRRATGIVLGTLILWISEVAPLGVTALLIPVAATLAGVLKWSDALTAWGDQILFLFLGAFLLARGLDKHGVFDFLVRARWARRFQGGHGAGLAIVVMLVAGAVSTMQSNTAVAAMLLPVVLALARQVRNPALVLLGLSYGATFGGMATPIGTPPNFIGYAAMQKLDDTVSFISWLRVGIPVWLGTTALAWGLLSCVRVLSRERAEQAAELGPDALPDPATGRSSVGSASTGASIADDLRTSAPAAWGSATAVGDRHMADAAAGARSARRWVIAAFAFTVAIWLTGGVVTSLTHPGDAARVFVERYLPESLAPILAACVLFIVRAGPRREPILDRRDFQVLDWDTLFLIAGGLCLGKMLQSSGAATALASAAGGVHVSPLLVMFGLGGATLLLSELTSNTATAALMVPIASSLAPAVGLSPVKTIWLVAMCASLGFALPVATPPNAIVYGTRMVPLRLMVPLGLAVDVLALIWVVGCMRWLT